MHEDRDAADDRDERDHIASERVERHVREDVLFYDLEDGGRVAVRPSGAAPAVSGWRTRRIGVDLRPHRRASKVSVTRLLRKFWIEKFESRKR